MGHRDKGYKYSAFLNKVGHLVTRSLLNANEGCLPRLCKKNLWTTHYQLKINVTRKPYQRNILVHHVWLVWNAKTDHLWISFVQSGKASTFLRGCQRVFLYLQILAETLVWRHINSALVWTYTASRCNAFKFHLFIFSSQFPTRLLCRCNPTGLLYLVVRWSQSDLTYIDTLSWSILKWII